ncbi:MAG TPA: hypothetical protein VF384_01285 [Planctomycetota bacterium]
MNDKHQDLLIEQATTAWRPRDPEGAVAAHPAFWDLDPPGRVRLHEAIERQRLLEAALDAEGWSSTARAVIERIRRGRA